MKMTTPVDFREILSLPRLAQTKMTTTVVFREILSLSLPHLAQIDEDVWFGRQRIT
jgi:hypothetical protein